MVIIKEQKPFTLFFSWGAYVFLPINMIIGTMIYTSGASVEELLISSLVAMTIMMILAYPAVTLSSKNGMNYAECIQHYISSKRLSNILIVLIPLINTGWYSIQTSMFVDLVQVYTNKNFGTFVILVIIMSYVFALGVTKFEYSWLKNVGFIGMCFLLMMIGLNIKMDYDVPCGHIRIESVLVHTIQILGTWIFSSVTCIMDITAYVKDGKRGFKYIILATFVTNIMLIILGFLLSVSIEEFVLINVMNLLAILAALWTTNDSNFYSTLCSLKVVGLSKKKVLLFVPLIAGLLSIILSRNLELYLTNWLTLMSWIGIPLGIMWWVIYGKEWR